MAWLQVTFPVGGDQGELLSVWLDPLGFEAFWPQEQELMGYITPENWPPAGLDKVLADFGLKTTNLLVAPTEEKDWNATWEASIEPLWIEDRVRIRASFHESDPKAEHELIVTPRMAFGTGHHGTTYLMVKTLLELPVEGLDVLDAGTGTGVLAILAHKRGARRVVAYDNDTWAYENLLDNAKENGAQSIEMALGTLDEVPAAKGPFQVILANITRNVLLAEMNGFAARLDEKGYLVLSGCLPQDLPVLQLAAQDAGLRFVRSDERENWLMAVFQAH